MPAPHRHDDSLSTAGDRLCAPGPGRPVHRFSTSNVWRAAAWYAIAYVIITFVAAWPQGYDKDPIYQWMIERWGATGETGADVVTMIINALLSFVVFFPILTIIFRREPADGPDATGGEPQVRTATGAR